MKLSTKHMMIKTRVSNMLMTRFETSRKNSCLSAARVPIINFTISQFVDL